ncbi:hypothetical protein D9M68_571070 [compost metagenome]
MGKYTRILANADTAWQQLDLQANVIDRFALQQKKAWPDGRGIRPWHASLRHGEIWRSLPR